MENLIYYEHQQTTSATTTNGKREHGNEKQLLHSFSQIKFLLNHQNILSEHNLAIYEKNIIIYYFN